MARSSKDALGAKKKGDVLQFDPSDLTIIGLDTKDGPEHPLYDKRILLPLKESFVLNIKAFGVHTPIRVRKNPETGKTEVVYGRQRVRALREANKRLKKEGQPVRLIPAIVERSTQLMAIRLTENEQRTNLSAVLRAEEMQRMLDAGYDEEVISVTFGLSAASVKNHVAVLGAPSCVRKAFESEAITSTQAYQLSKLPKDEAEKKLERLLKEAPRDPDRKRSVNAKKARNIMNEGAAAPAMRSRKEIQAMAERSFGAVRTALEWVLGILPDEAIVASPKPIESTEEVANKEAV